MSMQADEGDQLGLWREPAAAPAEGARTARGRSEGHAGSGRSAAPAPDLPARRPLKPMDYSELWTIEDVANYLGVPKQTIYSWRHTGYGPKGFRVGKHLRWRSAAVIAWTLGLEKDE